eukprot:COSAG06_NODE_2289_length_7148_cov_2.086679_11_plen_84_part_00
MLKTIILPRQARDKCRNNLQILPVLSQVVLDHGNLIEHGSGAELLDIEDGIFANLVNETGPTQAPRLRQIARDTAAKRAQEAQ